MPPLASELCLERLREQSGDMPPNKLFNSDALTRINHKIAIAKPH
jgi:hypothetical protein